MKERDIRGKGLGTWLRINHVPEARATKPGATASVLASCGTLATSSVPRQRRTDAVAPSFFGDMGNQTSFKVGQVGTFRDIRADPGPRRSSSVSKEHSPMIPSALRDSAKIAQRGVVGWVSDPPLRPPPGTAPACVGDAVRDGAPMQPRCNATAGLPASTDERATTGEDQRRRCVTARSESRVGEFLTQELDQVHGVCVMVGRRPIRLDCLRTSPPPPKPTTCPPTPGMSPG